MIELTILNLVSKTTFVKQFSSPFLARKFFNKAKRSKKIRVIAAPGIIFE